jgi:hypothetical protein
MGVICLREHENPDLAVCLITGPFGTYEEMSEGLAAVK